VATDRIIQGTVDADVALLPEVDTLSTHCQHTVNTLSTHCQHTVKTLSTRYQHIINTLSTHYQHTINTLSTHYQHTINTLSTHFHQPIPRGSPPVLLHLLRRTLLTLNCWVLTVDYIYSQYRVGVLQQFYFIFCVALCCTKATTLGTTMSRPHAHAWYLSSGTKFTTALLLYY